MYNIGGDGSYHSILRSLLGDKAPHIWTFVDLVHFNFKVYHLRAFAVTNKIVYFRCYHKDATYVWSGKKSQKAESIKEDRDLIYEEEVLIPHRACSTARFTHSKQRSIMKCTSIALIAESGASSILSDLIYEIKYVMAKKAKN